MEFAGTACKSRKMRYNRDRTQKEETEVAKYVCSVCGYEYDEETGDPDNGIAPGTKWEDIPEDFTCPLCGVGKDLFEEA